MKIIEIIATGIVAGLSAVVIGRVADRYIPQAAAPRLPGRRPGEATPAAETDKTVAPAVAPAPTDAEEEHRAA
jgi:hypothetical protein